jgi:hypothetical protein
MTDSPTKPRSGQTLIRSADMYNYVCQMYYKDKLYSGHYWGEEYSKARACKAMVELQRYRPGMRFVLTDYKTGAIIKTTEYTHRSAQ